MECEYQYSGAARGYRLRTLARGERLVVDPNDNSVLYFGARSGNGLLKSTDYGATWEAVSGLPSAGTYVADPSDTTGYNSDIIGMFA